MAQVVLVQGGDCIIGALKLDSLRVHILGAMLLIKHVMGPCQFNKYEITKLFSIGYVHRRPNENIKM